MADVNISKYSTQVVREGSRPAAPGFIVSEGQDPVNPPGTNNYVPYTGATANVELGEYGLESGFVTLDTTPTNTPADQGTIYWDDSRSTAALIMNGTLQHIGQDTFFYVKNSTGSNIAKGTAVRFAGTDGASGHLLIAPFLANGTYPSNYFMGVTAEAIANGSFGQVMHFGELQGVNTSGYTAGDLLYASTSVAGAFQTTAPVAPNNIVLVAAAINSTNNGTILVRPTYGSNINQDEGVKIVSPTTGDLLQLQAGGLWENKTKAQILGGTSSQFVKGDGSLDSTSYQPLLTNPVTGTGTTNYLPKFTGSTTIGNSVIADNASEINIPKRIFLNSGSESIFLTPNLSSASNRIEGSSGVPLEITTGGSSLKFAAGGTTPQFTLASSGAATFTGSVTASSIIKSGGTSTQYLMADGSVSTLTNPVTGTGTTNYLPKFTGTSTIGNSQIFDNGNGVGINTASPYTATNFTFVTTNNTSGSGYVTRVNNTLSALIYSSASGTIISEQRALPLIFETNGTSQLTLNSSGNLGLGVTPSAWGNNYKALQIGNASFWSVTSGGTGTFVSQNAFFDGASWKYISNGFANVYIQTDTGKHEWLNAVSGTSGNSISWFFPMTLTSGGNLLVGTRTDAGYKLDVNGTGRFTSSVTATTATLSNTVAITLTASDSRIVGGNSTGRLLLANSGTTTFGIFHGASHATLPNAIQFYNDNTASLTIPSNGNVLIGTTTDAGFKLDVNGTGRFSNILVANSDIHQVSTGGLYWGAASTYVIGVTGNTANGNLSFITGSTVKATITSGGNVGIGTASPSQKLEVNSGGSSSYVLVVGQSRNLYLGQDSIGAAIYSDGSAPMYFATNATERMRITSGGNVLIGTTTDSGYKLDVNGVTRSSISYKIGTYTQGTTTPSVSNVSFMIISNSSSTTISNFTNAVDGQILTLLFTDSNTTINRVNAYLLNGANYTSGPNDTIKLIYSSGLWYEISRSSNA